VKGRHWGGFRVGYRSMEPAAAATPILAAAAPAAVQPVAAATGPQDWKRRKAA